MVRNFLMKDLTMTDGSILFLTKRWSNSRIFKYCTYCVLAELIIPKSWKLKALNWVSLGKRGNKRYHNQTIYSWNMMWVMKLHLKEHCTLLLSLHAFKFCYVVDSSNHDNHASSLCYKSVSSNAQYVTLQNYFSHPTPPIKLKLGLQIGGDY
jgi:hypothetical protein